MYIHVYKSLLYEILYNHQYKLTEPMFCFITEYITFIKQIANSTLLFHHYFEIHVLECL